MFFIIPYQEVTSQGNIMRTDTWSISCRISTQRMSLSSTIAATMDDELVSPEGTQEGKNTYPLLIAAIRL